MLSNRHRNHRKGVGLPWAIIMLLVLCAMASLAVDYGRVQVVKNQLRGAADAAALAGGQEVLADPVYAKQAAIDTAKANKADGSPVILQSGDVVPVIWNETNHTYTLPSGTQKPNAVMVTAYRTAARGN